MKTPNVPTAATPSEPSGYAPPPPGPTGPRKLAPRPVPTAAHPTVALGGTDGPAYATAAAEVERARQADAPRRAAADAARAAKNPGGAGR